MHLLALTPKASRAEQESSPSSTRPNIVFLLADDQCTYSMGCYDTPGAKTPNLDQLAHEGMVFDNHYDTTAICMASRVNIMTGLYEYRSGCNFEHGALLADHWTRSYPMLLRSAGYRTAFAGKFGFEVSDEPGKKGRLPESDFNRWGGGPGQTSYQTAKNASMRAYAAAYPHSTLSYGAFGRDFITDSAKGEQPFCLSIGFKAPHHPVQPDPQFDDIYRDVVFTKPANYGRENGEHFSLQSRQGRQYDRFDSWSYRQDYQGVMAKYYQQIYAIDVAVGMVREAIEKAGVAENTVIIYTSDNGFLCGSHGYGSKVLPYEEASHVPLIVFDPRIHKPGGQARCAALTGNIDLMPTILELAGVPAPSELDGKSIRQLLTNPAQEFRESLTLINVWGPKEVHSLSVVTPTHKYIYWPYAGQQFEATEELYRIADDRLELNELSGRPEYQTELEQAREVYSQALSHWRQKAVPYHNYTKFADIFDPSIAWETKVELYRKR